MTAETCAARSSPRNVAPPLKSTRIRFSASGGWDAISPRVNVRNNSDLPEPVAPTALRDMIQNHLMQILAMIAMEPMVSFDANEIRSKKVDVLKAIHPISEEHVKDVAVRGQYGEGLIEREKVPAYRSEPGVAQDSATETFAAIKLFVDNWRWQGVPFYPGSQSRPGRS